MEDWTSLGQHKRMLKCPGVSWNIVWELWACAGGASENRALNLSILVSPCSTLSVLPRDLSAFQQSLSSPIGPEAFVPTSLWLLCVAAISLRSLSVDPSEGPALRPGVASPPGARAHQGGVSLCCRVFCLFPLVSLSCAGKFQYSLVFSVKHLAGSGDVWVVTL